MPTTRAASAPSRRAIRKEEIKRQVPVANQLQVTKSSLVPSNHTVKAFCGCLTLSRRLQYARMFTSEIARRIFRIGTRRTGIGPIGIGVLAALIPFLSLSLQAQSPGTVAGGRDSVLTPPNTNKTRQAFEKGQRAESLGDWESAFQAYRDATALSPDDRAIQLREQLARSALAQQRTEQAERQLLNGNPALARALLQSALEVDPSYAVAQERLQELAQVNPSPTVPGDNLASALPVIKANASKRNFDYSGTTHAAYEELARQFGVTAAFDPELQDRQIRFRVSDVDFDTAMRLLSEQTNTFWFAADAKTFFVAADTANKRRDYDPEIKKTIPLPAAETNDEMTEAMRMVRDIVGLRRTELDLKTHSITLRDTPANVELAEAILKDVQQPPGEFLLEVDLLEVDRNATVDLGIAPPTSVKTFSLSTGIIRELQQAQSSGTLLQAIQNIFGTQNPLAASGGAAAAIPPLIAFGGGSTIFLATLPGATANFSRTLSMVRSAQRVLLRVEDGRPATFFVGDHFPITLALLSASLVAPVSQLSTSALGSLTPSFPRTDFPVGHSPSAVAVGDFNGDGKLDIGVANFTDNTISILLGNGDGTFTAGRTITGVNSPVAMVTGDFRSAGKLDLAVLDQADGLVSVFPGNGDGTFATKIDTSAGRSPSALVTGDFNGDGKTDLAVTNSGSNSVSVLLGNGDGTFFKRIDFGTGVGPSAIAGADFNGDGRPDLAVTNKVDNTLSILLGNGDGTFGAPTSFTTAAGPAALLSGNFASGTFPDLIVVCESANTLDVFLGLGNASFATPLSVPTGISPVAAAKGDFAGTGLLDVAVANQSSNTVSVILNAVNNRLSSSAPLTSYPASEYVDLGLKVHATPRVHPPDEVSLNMQFDISALTGQNVNGIPILSNRTIQQVVRLRANETSILSGLIESSELRSITGWPGLTFLGPVTSDRSKQQSDTELVIAITPRQLRLTPREGRTFYAGRGVGTVAPPGPVVPGQTLPLPPGAPPAGVPPAPSAAPPVGAPGAPQPGPNPVPGTAEPPNPFAPPNPQPNMPPPVPPQGGTRPPNPER